MYRVISHYLERATLSGRIFTERALERLLAGMHTNMNFEVRSLDGRIIALAALERLNSGVFGRMLG